LTADSRGYLEPCGCRRDQAGGLPGRATLIDAVPAASRLTVDAGNVTSGGRAYEQLKTRYLLEGMRTMGYDAVNLGQTEAGLDLATLRRLTASQGVPFVSANVLAKDGGARPAPAMRIVRRGSLRIGITGVTQLPDVECGPGVTVVPPIEALAPVIAGLRNQCDVLVVLAFVDADAEELIAKQYPEIDCILGGDVWQSSSTVVTFNRAACFNVTDRGKVLGELSLVRHGSRYAVDSGRGVKVAADRVARDPAMAALIARYKDELRNRRYELASAEGMERIGSGQGTADEYVGDAACASCHAVPHQVFASSAHAHAYTTLVSKGSQYDPECLSCHTVGYGLYSGFVDAQRTPQLENVQCESCHGRGKEHIEAMQAQAAGRGAASPSTLRPVTPATCIRCHDSENSENFRYAAFWPRIKH